MHPDTCMRLLVLGAKRSVDALLASFPLLFWVKKEVGGGRDLPNGLAGSPDFKITDILHFLLILFSVVGLGVVVQASLRLLAGLDAIVQFIEQWLQGSLESRAPVDRTAPGGGRASSIHPVHAVSADEGVQALCGLLDGLVESFTWGVATFAQDLVLGKEHSVDTAHQAAALAVEIRVDFAFKGGFIKITTADGDTESNSLLLGLAGYILENSDGRVDATALAEESADGAAGALGCNQDDVDIRWDVNLGLVFEDRGKAMGEVQGLRLH